METEIDVMAILKDKPQGVKLYSSICGAVELKEVLDVRRKKSIVVKELNSSNQHRFWHDGKFFRVGQCVLQPSKEMSDWSKFTWKKGDVLVCKEVNSHIIFEKFNDDTYTTFTGKQNYQATRAGYNYFHTCNVVMTQDFDIEKDDAAQTYINTIEERLGGKFNRETLEVEKAQLEFKDGDIVCISGMGYLAYGIVKSIDYSSKKLEYYVLDDMSFLKINDWLSLEDKQIQPITETQQIILFEALAKVGKAWDAEKKQIVDLKPKCEFKPFQKVLTRDRDTQYWEAELFGFEDGNGLYHCVGGSWKCCVPYEGNESLLGTTKDVEG